MINVAIGSKNKTIYYMQLILRNRIFTLIQYKIVNDWNTNYTAKNSKLGLQSNKILEAMYAGWIRSSKILWLGLIQNFLKNESKYFLHKR